MWREFCSQRSQLRGVLSIGDDPEMIAKTIIKIAQTSIKDASKHFGSGDQGTRKALTHLAPPTAWELKHFRTSGS
ncbi:hypothetical protein [Bradyrhizobium sp. Gha]|uniref:hypothetical protein n=1 Tax=Bradyrhizobium sp. Gha TaxID=1855318 RepID=UPI001160BA36|nr:hypothetical protein [Bradyrhizobium sp. Gha]